MEMKWKWDGMEWKRTFFGMYCSIQSYLYIKEYRQNLKGYVIIPYSFAVDVEFITFTSSSSSVV